MMKTVKIILALFAVSIVAHGQVTYQDTADLRIAYFGIPSQIPDPDFVKSQTTITNAYLYYLTDVLDSMFNYRGMIYFQDSSLSKNYTTSYANLTNTANDLFTLAHANGISTFNDSISITNAGEYIFQGNFVHDGDSAELVTLAIYNVTADSVLPILGSQTMWGADVFGTTPVFGIGTITAGDTLLVRYKGSSNGAAVFKHGSLYIERIHE